jgi:transcriptional regulator with XRE-family HTH domain
MINNFLLDEFGAKIRQLRVEQGLSQEQLSFKTGFHRTYIGMVERGERNISLNNIGVFGKVFNLTISKLLEFPDEESHIARYQIKSTK